MSTDNRRAVKLNIPEISRLYLILAVGCIVAIIAHLSILILPIENTQKHFASNSVLWFMIVVGGVPVIFQILRNIFIGEFGVDIPAVISIVVACILQEYLAATLVILMLTGGQALEAYAMRKASSVLLALVERMPLVAKRKEGEIIREIPLEEIKVGDHIVIPPHEICPVDGTVIDGHGSMDESYLTGEPYLISKAPGTSVLSGTINGDSMLLVTADKLTSDSRYAKIMKVMEEAEQKRPKLRRIADKLGIIFAPLSLGIAILTAFATGDSVKFLSVLIIATPCPLLIAIPVTIISAISIAAKRGLIIKDPRVLELLPTCKTAIFDKTGTLTYGEPELVEILPAAGGNPDSLLQLAASMELYSKHPLAKPILKAARLRKLLIPTAATISEIPGQGLVGNVRNKNIKITSRKILLNLMPEAANNLPPLTDGLECMILVDSDYAGTLKFRDQPREDGINFITHLTPIHAFKKIMLVSGDRESEVTYLANALGIENIFWSQSPEQKLKIVTAEAEKSPTLYVGDGINDAPALMAATVGIAFGQHNAVTSEASGAVILENSLTKVDELLHISIKMRRIALESAIGGMALSIMGMVLAAFGFISPVGGALAQEIIDVVAILNALRLVWQRDVSTDIHVWQKGALRTLP